ncbi:hypothetical protein E6H30_00325 [Candidatus Bathyarchaeota archaeon]|nr:MAG: hypothetical protein E6H30_00325 [Candidatus Bathyarchaeota archaeon]
MNSTCVGPCVHDVGCGTVGVTSSGLDARGTKFLDKLRPIPNDPKASARMRFYQGGTPTSAFREFHNSRVMKKMRPRVEYWKYSAQRYASRNSIR